MADWQKIGTAEFNSRVDVLCTDGEEPHIFHDVLMVEIEPPYAFADIINGRLKVYRPHENGMWAISWRPSTSPEAELATRPRSGL